MKYEITYKNKSFNINCDDMFMSFVLSNGKFYEENMLKYIDDLSIDGIYLDIGAFIGTHSIFFSEICKYCTGVVSYEPISSNYKILESNVKEYSKIKTKQMAVGRSSGICDMNIVKENMGMCYVSEIGKGTIPMTTIDDDFKDIIERIGLIKIDVEGYEYEILLGSKNTLSKFRPHLFIEIINDISEIENFLKQYNYEIINKFNNTPTYHFNPI